MATTASPATKVLVADDVPINLRILALLLTRLGCQTHLAGSGVEAILQVQNHSFDLVLIDIHMPEMDGLTAIRRIRSLQGSIRQPRIVAMTGLLTGQPGDVLATGADDLLLKPIHADQLKAVVSNRARPRHRTSHPDRLLDKNMIDSLKSVGDYTFLRELVETAHRDMPRCLAELEQSLRQECQASVLGLAHRLKGMAATIGGGRLAALIAQMEEQAGRGDFEDPRNSLDATRETLSHTLRELKLCMLSVDQL